MALVRLVPKPGVNIQASPTQVGLGWAQSQLIRFFNGLLQKLGGWTALPGVRLMGTCRGIFGYADYNGVAHLAAGSEDRLSVITGGTAYDITPVVATTNAAPAVATVAASRTVGIADTSYSPSPGDWIYIATPISRGGITLGGYYQVTNTPTISAYAILSAQAASLTTAADGVVPTFSTITGSAIVTIYLPDHNLIIGANFEVTTSTIVGGITLSGLYPVSAVLDSATFQINAYATASSVSVVAQNSGLMQIRYLLPAGFAKNSALGGWGAGDWGAGPWGQTTAGTTSVLIQKARIWNLDHFGQNLIAAPSMGAIYTWAPPVVQPAALLSGTAPSVNHIVFAIAQAQIIMACGSSVGSSYFPTLLRWCDSGNMTDWVASAINQAGSYQVPTGSFITAGLSIGLGALIWTDVDLWSVTYQGLPFVFSFNRIGTGCEALSSRAPVAVGSLVVWPSTKGFQNWQGGPVSAMECPVWDYLFNNLDMLQSDLVFGAANTEYHEIAWHFPTTEGDMAYVKWNYLENVWDYGQLDRTAWCDRSPYGAPCGSDSGGLIQQHETGTDANGAPMTCYAQTGYFEVGEGDVLTYINTIIPDLVANSAAQVDVTLYAVDYPGQTPRTYGPFAVTSTTPRINCSVRGRQVAFRFGSSDTASAWRIGAVRWSATQAGTRP